MKIKICGMKRPANIATIATADLDYMGFIFYNNSQRFVGENFNATALDCIPENIRKTAVFVNESVERVHKIAFKYNFNCIQLHGNESPAFCKALKTIGYTLIKTFSMDENFNFNLLKAYEEVVDLFLFDTPTKEYGGSGNAFNWKLVEKYEGSVPFFLSGGLGLHNINELIEFNHPKLYGLDFNSRLEIKPGIKAERSVKLIISKIKNHERV